jgi:hypothetical protein
VSDPFDVLRRHVRGQAAEGTPSTSTDELVAHITLEHHRGDGWPESSQPRPRRWGMAAAVVAACVGVGAGAVVTAALDRSQVDQSALVACHPSVDEPDLSMLVRHDDDPIGACRSLWQAGRLPLLDQESPPSDPALVLCMSEQHVLEVFPGSGPDVCRAVGSAPVDLPTDVADPVRELDRRVVDEINPACLPFDQAVEAARSLLDELGLAGWNVVAIDDGGRCALVGVSDIESRTLNVRTVAVST